MAKAGDTIGTVECPDCTATAPVKVNKNGSVYITCTAIIEPATRERCYYRRQYGRVKSRAIIKEYEGHGGPENQLPANDNGAGRQPGAAANDNAPERQPDDGAGERRRAAGGGLGWWDGL